MMRKSGLADSPLFRVATNQDISTDRRETGRIERDNSGEKRQSERGAKEAKSSIVHLNKSTNELMFKCSEKPRFDNPFPVCSK